MDLNQRSDEGVFVKSTRFGGAVVMNGKGEVETTLLWDRTSEQTTVTFSRAREGPRRS